MAVHDDDSGVAADVAERLVVRARDYVAAVAAHETKLGAHGGCVCVWRNRLVP